MSAELSGSSVEVDGLNTPLFDQLPAFMRLQMTEVNVRSDGFIECKVPLSLLDNDNVPINHGHSEFLAKQMDKEKSRPEESGQVMRILVGYVEGEPFLPILDGFHRDDALRSNGATSALITIKPTDWEGVFSERILHAKDNIYVRFSRVVDWMQKSWQLTGISDHLTIEEAVSIFMSDSSGKRKAKEKGLTPEEIQTAKAWVGQKQNEWEINAATIYSHLKVSAHVDSTLVQATRPAKKHGALEHPTNAILNTFAREIPIDSEHSNRGELQRLIMDTAIAQNLNNQKIAQLCRHLVNSENIEAAQAEVAGIDWSSWRPAYSDSKERAYRRAHDPRRKGTAVFEKAAYEIGLIQAGLSQSLKKGETVQIETIEAAKIIAEDLRSKLGTIIVGLENQTEQIRKEADEASRLETEKIEAELGRLGFASAASKTEHLESERQAKIQAKADEKNSKIVERERVKQERVAQREIAERQRQERKAERERRATERTAEAQRKETVKKLAAKPVDPGTLIARSLQRYETEKPIAKKVAGVRKATVEKQAPVPQAKKITPPKKHTPSKKTPPSVEATRPTSSGSWRDNLEAMKSRYGISGQSTTIPESSPKEPANSGSSLSELYKSSWVKFVKSRRPDDEIPEIITHLQLKQIRELRETLGDMPVNRSRLAEVDEAIEKAEQRFRDRTESFGPKDKTRYPSVSANKKTSVKL